MKLSGYLEEQLTITGLKPTDKGTLIDEMLRVVEKSYPLDDRKKVLEDLMMRERQSTTGIGGGVAIPHAIVESLAKTVMVLASVPDGMEFQSVDRSPVYVVFLLLSPPNRVREHIKLLARIARICSSPTVVQQIAQMRTSGEIIELIKGEDEIHVG